MEAMVGMGQPVGLADLPLLTVERLERVALPEPAALVELVWLMDFWGRLVVMAAMLDLLGMVGIIRVTILRLRVLAGMPLVLALVVVVVQRLFKVRQVERVELVRVVVPVVPQQE